MINVVIDQDPTVTLHYSLMQQVLLATSIMLSQCGFSTAQNLFWKHWIAVYLN